MCKTLTVNGKIRPLLLQKTDVKGKTRFYSNRKRENTIYFLQTAGLIFANANHSLRGTAYWCGSLVRLHMVEDGHDPCIQIISRDFYGNDGPVRYSHIASDE